MPQTVTNLVEVYYAIKPADSKQTPWPNDGRTITECPNPAKPVSAAQAAMRSKFASHTVGRLCQR